MPTIISGQVGPQTIADGVKGVEFRQGRTAEQIIAQAHGRYTEPTYRGTVFTLSTAAAGVTLAAANASTTAATAQPVVGFLNPVGSGKNCAILSAGFGYQSTGAAAANAGVPVFQYAAPAASTTIAGNTPVNCMTLQSKGSVVIGSVNAAYTGNLITWAILRPLILPATLTAAPTASINVNMGGMEDVSGAIIVPPGAAFGIFVLAVGTTITVASSLTWEEIPL